jgi:hypothetical protein
MSGGFIERKPSNVSVLFNERLRLFEPLDPLPFPLVGHTLLIHPLHVLFGGVTIDGSCM